MLLGISLVLGACTRLMAFLGAWLMLVFGLVKALDIPLLTDAEQQELLRKFARTENKRVSPKSTRFFEKLKKHFSDH